MATKWEAGHAFVSIIPSMDGFHRRLQRELAKYNDEIKVPVDAETKKAEANVDRLVKHAQRQTAEIKVDADTAKAEGKIAQLEATKRAATIQVDADIERAKARISELEGKRGRTSIDVDAEITMAQAKIASLQAKREAITIKADADTAVAQAKLASLDHQVTNLNGRRAVVTAEAQGAERGIHIMSALFTATAAVGAMGPVAAAGLATISPALAGVGFAAATMAIGFNGVGAAIKATNTVTDEFGNATAAQIDKMNDSMAALTQEGRNFVIFFTGEFRATMQGIGNSVQSSLLPYFEQSLRNLSLLAPHVTTALTGTAHVLGQLALQGSAMMTSGPWTQDFLTLSMASNSMLWSLGQAGLQLADAFRSITIAALPLTMRLAETIQNSALMFNAWIQGARDSGQLQVWFSQMGETLFRIGETVKNVVIALFNLSQALAPIGSLVLSIVNSIALFITHLSQVAPGLLQFIAVGYIATSAFIGLGTAIGGIASAGAAAIAGFQLLATGLLALPARVGVATASLFGLAGASNAVATAAGGALAGVTRFVGYLGIAALAIGAVLMVHSALTTSVNEAADAYLRGGAAAEQARVAMSTQLDTMHSLKAGFWDFLNFLNPLGSATDYQTNRQYFLNQQMGEAAAKAHQMLMAMNPLERAQALVTQATNDHAWAVERFGVNSPQAAAAAGHLAFQTNQLEWQQHLAAQAAKSHTDKLVEQQNQMISMLQSDLAYRMSLQQVDQAQRALTDAVNQHGAGSAQAQQAELQYEQSLLRAAEASRKKAEESYKGFDASEKARLGTEAYNREIFNLVQKAGDQAPAALRNYIGSLDLSTLRAIGAKVETDNFGNAVVRLPNGKAIAITTPGIGEALRYTNDLKRQIDTIPAEKSIRIHVDRILGPGLQQSNPGSGIPLPLGNAVGRIAQFANGGLAGSGLNPMEPIAKVVPPNTWRVVGDNMTVDEAYIPLDGSARSMAILQEAAKRMGVSLLPTGTSTQPMAEGGMIGSVSASTANAVNAATTALPTPEQIQALTTAIQLLDAAVIAMVGSVNLLALASQFLNGNLALVIGNVNLLGFASQFANGVLAMTVGNVNMLAFASQFLNGTLALMTGNMNAFAFASQFLNGTLAMLVGSSNLLSVAVQFLNGNLGMTVGNANLLAGAGQFLNGVLFALTGNANLANGAFGFLSGSLLIANGNAAILTGTLRILDGLMLGMTGSTNGLSQATYGLRDSLIAQDVQARINNGTGVTLHGTLGHWRFLTDNLAAATTNLERQMAGLNANGLAPLVNQLNGSTIPTLQNLELHAGILTPQAIAVLHRTMNPLAQAFEDAGFRMRDQFQQTTNHIGVKNGEIQGHFRSLTDGMRATEHAIFLASQGIRGHWDAIKGYAHGPMKWVVDVVWNTGLLPIWNGVAEIFGQRPLGPVQFHNDGGAIFRAGGGGVPGPNVNRDVVPAMLTPGEYVLSRPAIANMGGIGAVHAAHQAARNGNKSAIANYNTGGAVNPNGHTWPILWDIARGFGPDVRKTSDFRPGHSGYHGKGQAVDLASNNMPALAEAINRKFPNATQIIMSAWRGGLNKLNGRDHRYTDGSYEGHFDHVHWAMTPAALGGATDPLSPGGMVDPRVFQAIDAMKKLKEKVDPGVNGFFGGRGNLGWPTLQRSQAHKVIDGLLKKAEEHVSAASAMGGGFASANPEAVAAVRETARQFGWDQGPEWDALFRLVHNESGWNPGAANPTSSARGLFQKMINLHGPVEPTPGGQALWGLNYIKGKYGSPSRALAFWNAQSPHWYNSGGAVGGEKPTLYDSGGWLQPGPTYTYNGTRKPEAVLTSEDYQMMHRAATNGGQVTTNVYAAPDWSPDRVGRAVNRHVDNALRS